MFHCYINTFYQKNVYNSTFIEAYDIDITNGCVVYGTAAIIHYYLSGSYDDILAICKNVAETQGYATYSGGTWNYYISLGSTDPFVQACIVANGLNRVVGTSFLLSAARTEIDNDRPCLLNIWYYDSVSVDHTVTAIGWRDYNLDDGIGGNFDVTFYKVIDGDCSAPRYLQMGAITGVFVTKVH